MSLRTQTGGLLAFAALVFAAARPALAQQQQIAETQTDTITETDTARLEAPVCADSLLFGRKLVRSVKPVFETTRDGAFELEILVRPDGSVASVEIIAQDAPEPQVEAAVRAAVLQWRFTPLDVDFDQRVKMTYAYTYEP